VGNLPDQAKHGCYGPAFAAAAADDDDNNDNIVMVIVSA